MGRLKWYHASLAICALIVTLSVWLWLRDKKRANLIYEDLKGQGIKWYKAESEEKY